MAGLTRLGAPNHARGFVVLHKPFHTLLHGLLEWSELEIWEIFPEFEVGGCLLVLAISLGGIEVDWALLGSNTKMNWL